MVAPQMVTPMVTPHFTFSGPSSLCSAQLARLGSVKARLSITFINQQGLQEAGIDMGGLMKEFLESVVSAGFDPNRGLFSATPDGYAYPSPLAGATWMGVGPASKPTNACCTAHMLSSVPDAFAHARNRQGCRLAALAAEHISLASLPPSCACPFFCPFTTTGRRSRAQSTHD